MRLQRHGQPRIVGGMTEPCSCQRCDIGWGIVVFAHVVVFHDGGSAADEVPPQLFRWILRFHLHWQIVELLATNPARGCTTRATTTGRGERKHCLLGAGVCLAVECVEVELASLGSEGVPFANASNDVADDVRWPAWDASEPNLSCERQTALRSSMQRVAPCLLL